MSRGAASRRRGDCAPSLDDSCQDVATLVDDSERRAERLDHENARLRDALEEAEGWYRLLQADHATLQARHGQLARKECHLRAEADRLESKNRGLEAHLHRDYEPGRQGEPVKDDTTMNRIKVAVRAASRHKWASAAVVALATLLARDPGVQAVFSTTLARVGEIGRLKLDASEANSSGYVLYAAMSQAREDSEKARTEYNNSGANLKGDELLEAQDRLRASKSRYRQARLAFLPELIRHCHEAKLPVPKEALQAYASLKEDAGD